MKLDAATLKTKCKHYRISNEEYQKICQLLKREPLDIEWPLFSALWSEHCSYKSSKIHLRKFGKTMNATVVNASGENAGIIDLGQGERIAFKMESHNHPSFIEPFQGAATGVGGILRDIFTMGARPIALANYLCFGEVKAPRMKYLMDGVVHGISSYGNCVGVPTVTGQTNFDPSYSQNILVNALAVGLLRPGEKIALSQAQGVGNWVVYVGAKTGKDGVHGAAMASEAFDENSEAKKPNVQIGDPYFEKLLIESCLEAIQQGLVVSIQDMGAAGLTSSSFEMASKGQMGMDLHLDQVPLRDSSMTPEEILLSESQERMLMICEPSKLEAVEKLFSKWGLDACVVGKLKKQRTVSLFWNKELLTEIDPDLLVENAPVYERPFSAWASPRRVSSLPDLKFSAAKVKIELMQVLSNEIAGSRRPIYRQYDQRVGAMTAHGAESDVAIQRLPDSGRGFALAVGCRPFLMQVDAQIGAYDSVFYPALQMAIKGVRALAVTDCLNYGNPERPEIMSEFVASVDAITEASILLKAPVISGNVSFYNETMGSNITSTPATGVVGLRDHVDGLAADRFGKEGLKVLVLRLKGLELSGFGQKPQFKGEYNPQKVTELIALLRKAAMEIPPQASQVVGLGGLALALAKMSLDGIGCQAHQDLSISSWMKNILYQIVWVTDQAEAFEKFFQNSILAADVEILDLAITKKSVLDLGSELQFSLPELQKLSSEALQSYFQGVST